MYAVLQHVTRLLVPSASYCTAEPSDRRLTAAFLQMGGEFHITNDAGEVVETFLRCRSLPIPA